MFGHHLNQTGERFGFHFLHHSGAVDFDGTFTEPELVGDRFVRFAFDDVIHHFHFTRCEKLNSALDLGVRVRQTGIDQLDILAIDASDLAERDRERALCSLG